MDKKINEKIIKVNKDYIILFPTKDYNGGSGYIISKDKINTAQKIVEFVLHLSQKTWITAEMLSRFVEAAFAELNIVPSWKQIPEIKGVREYPQMRGFIDTSGTRIKVWCPHCRIFHVHGYRKEGDGQQPYGTHRQPHCHHRHDKFPRGYLVKHFSKKQLESF